MILETTRLIMRPWDVADANDLYEYARDERVGPICGWQAHKSVDESKEIIRNILSKPESFAIVLKEQDIVIGSISIMTGKDANIEIADDEGEIGFWLGVPFWGRGLMPEAVNEIANYAFNRLKLKKLWCGYFDGNDKSKRVQEKCGFIYNKVIENFYCKNMNELRTMHVTCLLKETANKRISVRRASLQDVDKILEIYSYYVENTAITFEYETPSKEEMLDRMEKFSSKYPFLVIECDKKVCGYSYANVFKSRPAYNWTCEMSIYVSNDMRKYGLGRKLYEEMEKALKSMGIVTLYACVTSIEKDDEYLTKNSVKFHEHLGYKLIGKFEKCGYKFDRWYDMIFMEKIIGEHTNNQSEVINYNDIAK
jgi:phosphinothricin acetyltransferase